jgi:hypothetical protein
MTARAARRGRRCCAAAGPASPEGSPSMQRPKRGRSARRPARRLPTSYPRQADRHKYVKIAYHGFRLLTSDERNQVAARAAPTCRPRRLCSGARPAGAVPSGVECESTPRW